MMTGKQLSYLDNGGAQAVHEHGVHRAQQSSSQAAELLLQRNITGVAFLVTLSLQAGYVHARLVQQPDVLCSSASIHTPAQTVS